MLSSIGLTQAPQPRRQQQRDPIRMWSDSGKTYLRPLPPSTKKCRARHNISQMDASPMSPEVHQAESVCYLQSTNNTSYAAILFDDGPVEATINNIVVTNPAHSLANTVSVSHSNNHNNAMDSLEPSGSEEEVFTANEEAFSSRISLDEEAPSYLQEFRT
ncbi:hypothetical protein A0J61_05078 [Choanephora cucurbitarum]|uniref:Uncharacterized protein n=1 Tax=Choanephora cucurbitarum TaxID=101091 RepID=A0A1C7NCX5_9FUNG|nr:hypothetical protein A0J61_05078 [Choanephora cucurbitarum]